MFFSYLRINPLHDCADKKQYRAYYEYKKRSADADNYGGN